MRNLDEALIVAIVFYSIYMIIKLFSTHLLKRKIINNGQFENVKVLSTIDENEKLDVFSSLKWGIIAFTTAIGIILVEVIRNTSPKFMNYSSALPFGIILFFLSLGFLIYFYIVYKKRISK